MHEFVVVLDTIGIETCGCHIERFRYPFQRIRTFLMLFPKSYFLRLHFVIFVPSQIRESKPVIAFQRE